MYAQPASAQQTYIHTGASTDSVGTLGSEGTLKVVAEREAQREKETLLLKEHQTWRKSIGHREPNTHTYTQASSSQCVCVCVCVC